MIVVSFVVYLRSLEKENEEVRVLTTKSLDAFADQLSQSTVDRRMSLERMAQRIVDSKNMDRGDWQADAKTYRNHLKGLKSIAVLNTKNEIEWLSSESETTALEMKSIEPGIWKSVIHDAQVNRTVTISKNLTSQLKSATCLIIVPLFRDGKWIGSLASILEIEPFLSSFLKLKGYQAEIRDANSKLFTNIEAEPAFARKWEISKQITVGQSIWNLRLVPTVETAFEHRSNLPNLIIIIGTFVAALMSAITRQALSLRLRSRAIDEQRKFLNTVIDNLPVAVFCKDHEDGLRFSVWNRKCEELFGLSREKVIGKSVFELFPNGSIQTLSDRSESIENRVDVPTSFEERISTEFSGVALLESRKISILDTSGRLVYTLGISEDVSKRRAIEIALKDSERKFSSFMENSPATAWIRNKEGEITYVNAAFKKSLTSDLTDVVGKVSLPTIPKDIEMLGLKVDQEVLRTGKPISRVRQIVDIEGTLRSWVIWKFPMTLSSGVEYVGAMGIDITDRVEAENTLAATTRTLSALIDSSPLPILTLDLIGNIQVWSPACEKIFGWTSDEVVGKPLPFVTASKRGESQEIIAKIIRSESAGFVTDALRMRKDGTLIHIRIAAQVLNDEITGKPRGLVAVMTDISEQMEVQRKLQEAKRQAEQAADMKSDFLANVSHEIRTPLNGIIGMTDILLETDLSDEQRKYANIVNNSGTILLNLINDILDLSKFEAGKMALEKTPFSLVSVVESHADLLIAKAREGNLSLMTYLESNLPSLVIGDPSRLAQVLVNLVGNAIKFTQRGGVSVHVSRDSSLFQSDSDNRVRVLFEVQDTGIGLSEDARKKLFIPFSQGESSTTRRFGGTGLGLSISKKLVESMGGTIGVESAEGQGSKFWFSVDFEKAVEPSVAKTLRCKEFDTARILIVDEDAIASGIVTRYLLAWGLGHCDHSLHCDTLQEVVRAENAGLAYDIILIGQGKNLSSAENLADSIKTAFGPDSPKLVLMSEFDMHLSPARLRESHFVAVVSKPIKQSNLFDTLSGVLAGPVVAKIASVANLDLGALAKPMTANTLRDGLHVLIADDVSTNQIIALKMIEGLGHSGHAVANGREAIEALKLREYDLVLMDCQMPQMDGFEATKLIRSGAAGPQNRDIMIVALTANAMERDRDRCIGAGMNDYLPKPIKKAALAKTILDLTPAAKRMA